MTELAFNVLPYRVTLIRTTVTDEEKRRKRTKTTKTKGGGGGGGGGASGRWGVGGGEWEVGGGGASGRWGVGGVGEWEVGDGGWASGRWGGGGGLTEDLAIATLTCRVCVRVIINKLYFEPFMCLVFSDSLSSNIPNILPAERPLPLQVWTQEPDS